MACSEALRVQIPLVEALLLPQAQELRHQLDQLLSELADAGVVLERRHLQVEHEQRHHDGEYAVAEGLDTGEAQLTFLETIEKTHCPRPAPVLCGLATPRRHRRERYHVRISRALAPHRLLQAAVASVS